MTKLPAIRPIALALVRRGEDLLVFEGTDRVTGATFYRPLGGGVEFGEPAEVALRRELREELAAELTSVELSTVLENIFEHEGHPGHEIVFLFSAALADRSLYEHDDVGVILDEGSPVRWVPLQEFAEGRATLYPTGLLDLLLGTSGTVH